MDDLVERVDEALKDVTPGPWTVKYDLGDTCLMMGSDCQMCDMTYYPWTPSNDADWHFIAAARELVPAMRDRIEADAARIAELEDAGRKLLANWQKEEQARDAAEAQMKELEALLREAREELANAVENEYPKRLRDIHPSMARYYAREMDLPFRIDAALEGEK